MTDRSLDAFVESRMRGNTHVRFGGRRRGNHRPKGRTGASPPTLLDALSLESDGERSVQRAVTARAPDICWDVTNQAGTHLWYPEVHGVELEPLTSSADAVGTSSETATAIAIRLLANDSIHVVAPCGLDDLFGLICRHNPGIVPKEQYRRRVERMQIAKRWPRVQILDARD
jgi:hypothetical protein